MTKLHKKSLSKLSEKVLTSLNQIFHQFTTEKEVWPYSIDESILDMTHTWRLFGNSVREVARLIQKTVRQKLGLYTTVGIGDNPVQAKLALEPV